MFKGMSYKQAGVDIEAAEQAVDRIKPWVEKTRRPEVLADIGGFGGFFALERSGSRIRYWYREPMGGTKRASPK